MFINCRDVATTTGKDGKVGLIAIHDFEQRMLQGRLDVAVNHEFSYWEKHGLVILPLPGKELEVLFDLLVPSFSLSIRLRVVCGCQLPIDTKLLVQGFNKPGYELWSLVTDNAS